MRIQEVATDNENNEDNNDERRKDEIEKKELITCPENMRGQGLQGKEDGTIGLLSMKADLNWLQRWSQ
ncbi:MAG: hypothetical protein M3270_10820 [Thermoproteota archaeon]|nr:hypothetical protein [Thermoproteota archaeon]